MTHYRVKHYTEEKDKGNAIAVFNTWKDACAYARDFARGSVKAGRVITVTPCHCDNPEHVDFTADMDI